MKGRLSIFRTILVLGALLALIIFVASCSRKSGGSSEGPLIAAATITAQANPASITVNGTSIITATVQDSAGNPVPDGTSVSFTLSSAAYGILSSATGTTASGIATTTFTAGSTLGSVTITATSGAVSNVTTLTVVALPGTITVQANPSSITVNGTSTITATVNDNTGSPVPDGTSVSFTLSTAMSGSLSNSTVTTASGVATTTFNASATSGTVNITATSGSVSSFISLIVGTVPGGQAATGSIQFVSAVPQVIGIKGAGQPETSTIQFLVNDLNGNPVDGAVVSFIMTGPNGGEYIGDIDATPNTFTASTASGIVSVILHSGTIAGTVTLIASTPISGVLISSSTTPLSIGGGIPSATHFTLARTIINLEGFKYANLQSIVNAFVADRFGNYNVLNGTSVSFYTEAGAIDRQGITGEDNNEACHGPDPNPACNAGAAGALFRTQDPMPEDVPQSVAGDAVSNEYFKGGNEPYYTDILSSGVHTYNPRDGWATVLASTRGEETFHDENHDGLFTRSYKGDKCPYSTISTYSNYGSGVICECDGGTPGGYAGFIQVGETCTDPGNPGGNRSEGFIDLPEDPFYDVNDDRVWDDGQTLGHPFELYIDTNGNGILDSMNGKWDGPDCQTAGCETNKTIWDDTKMVISHETCFYQLPVGNIYSVPNCDEFPISPFADAPANIVRGTSGTFRVIVGDFNLNRLQGGTTIVLTATAGTVSEGLTVADGLSKGPSDYEFTVAIDLTEDATETEVTVKVVTPDGLITSTKPITVGIP